MAISEAQQDLRERDRLQTALNNPRRQNHIDPLRPELECPLGRAWARGKITKEQYAGGVRWREITLRYFSAIGAPYPFARSVGEATSTTGDEYSDIIGQDALDNLQSIEDAYKRGVKVLKDKGPRVFHAVQALVVYEEPDELGDFEFTLHAAKIGLSEIAAKI